MKSLNKYINEWKANTNTVSSIEKKNIQYFVYKLTTNRRIKIFDEDWPQYKDYKDKVYINNEQIELINHGLTLNEYEPGTYEVEIEDIDNITNCQYMFYNCGALISVPLFDTSNVKNMFSMFKFCNNLVNVPLFDVRNVEAMRSMFFDCEKLNAETKKGWSKVYNFYSHCKK